MLEDWHEVPHTASVSQKINVNGTDQSHGRRPEARYLDGFCRLNFEGFLEASNLIPDEVT